MTLLSVNKLSMYDQLATLSIWKYKQLSTLIRIIGSYIEFHPY